VTDHVERPRVAVIGTGGWGSNHVRVWGELGHLSLVCDRDEQRLRGVASSHPGIETEVDYLRVLQRDDIDAVVIATPAQTHAQLLLQALEASKHVLVEKPMALSQAEADEIAVAASGSDRVVMVDHVLEYHPAVITLSSLIDAGRLGRVLYLSAHRLNFGRVRTEEDALWSFAPHDLSLMVSLMGEVPVEVSAKGGAYLSPHVADVTLMNLEWSDNIRGYVFVSWLHPFKEHRFIVVGDRQMAVFDDTRPWSEKLVLYPHRVDWEGGRTPVAHRADASPVQLEEHEPLAEACRHFIHCIRSGSKPRTDAEDGRQVVALLEAGRRSLDTQGAPQYVGKTRRTWIHPSATVDPGAVIGEGTRVWHYSHISAGASIGEDCVLGQNVYVAPSAKIGNGVRVQNNVAIYDGVELEDHVFCGPSSVFTNVRRPRSEVSQRNSYASTVVKRGATIGANSTIVCPVNIGSYALVGAGAVVNTDVPGHAVVVGNPAHHIGWACACGGTLSEEGDVVSCTACDREYVLRDGELDVADESASTPHSGGA
jgi:UDP-2-acetamido-3-amino-2,3-dideoxy-glucuronate N-acetyltransferase